MMDRVWKESEVRERCVPVKVGGPVGWQCTGPPPQRLRATVECGFRPNAIIPEGCPTTEAGVVTTVMSEASSSFVGAQISVSCPDGTILTGCTCFSYVGCRRGAKSMGNTCTAYNSDSGSDRFYGVYAQARCMLLTSTGGPQDRLLGQPSNLGWHSDVTSTISGAGDDDTTKISCPAGMTLTGCSCYSDSNSCDGAYTTTVNGKSECVAQKGSGGKGVYAQGRCIKVETTSAKDISGSKSSSADDSQSVVTCDAGMILTGCSCHSLHNCCDGAKFDGNTCRAYNRHGGRFVRAKARCVKMVPCPSANRATLGCMGALSFQSQKTDIEACKVQCKADPGCMFATFIGEKKQCNGMLSCPLALRKPLPLATEIYERPRDASHTAAVINSGSGLIVPGPRKDFQYPSPVDRPMPERWKQ